ncbi:solute carrier family 2 member 13b [Danio rerio]|uniref:Glucose transporter 13a n=1 Tax=Danio rerio TaxID=7955 RepID=C3RUD8_DANRE|nr:solute carrier family 2 member 13b [Danio rerio]ACC95442.1 glucose transporter 13a [Danio rerio]|eukprot:NP_001153301.1 proton myo-inositol cotransporter [Danio rerio]
MEDQRAYARVEDESTLIKTASKRDHELQPGPPCFVYTLAFFSALGGFLFGYDTGVVSGAMLLLKREKKLSSVWQELLVSITVGAAAVSALAGGFLNGRFGRRVCILLASFIFCAGGIILSVARNKEALLCGRLTVGLGLGIASMTVPVYIAEVSPPDLRGQLVTVNTLFITGGQFIASVVDGAFSYLPHDGWRFMLGLSVVPAALQFLGFLFLPESPRWLLQKGFTQNALLVLRQIRGDVDVEEEFESIRCSIQEEQRDVAGGPVLWRMLASPPARRALIVGCGLQMFQQLAGINTVIYYSSLFTCTAVSLMVLAAGFLLSAQASPPVTFHPSNPSIHNSTCGNYGFCESCMLDPDCGFCYGLNATAVVQSSCVPVDPANTETAALGRCFNGTQKASSVFWAYNYCPTPYSWVVLLGLILYLAFFAPGMGPMPWTVNSEIYPLWARSTGNACSAGVNWICNVLVSLTFLHVAQYLTYYGAFFLYAALALLGFVFVSGCLPETKGLRLEEIESLFSRRLCSCGAHTDQYMRVNGGNSRSDEDEDEEE